MLSGIVGWPWPLPLSWCVSTRGFAPAEYATLQSSISDMVTALDLACHESMDPPDAPPL
ncbi:hypothetical protein B0H10DRAFT_2144158, partial [Mycena sp. CBHHK59/15]